MILPCMAIVPVFMLMLKVPFSRSRLLVAVTVDPTAMVRTALAPRFMVKLYIEKIPVIVKLLVIKQVHSIIM